MVLQQLRVVVNHHNRNAGGFNLLTRSLKGLVAPLGHKQHVWLEGDNFFSAEGAVV